jgi:hypothetical protein
MRLAIKIFYLLAGFLLLPVCTYSQGPVKGIIDIANFDEDNAVLGYTTHITLHVKFKSCITNNDTSVTGNLVYWYRTDSMWNSFQGPKMIDDNPAYEFVDGGGLVDTIPFYCDSAELRSSDTGPANVIIIWPSIHSPSIELCDSGFYLFPSVDVASTSGIEEEGPQKFGSTVFPNPAGSMQIVLIHSKHSDEIEKVIVTNTMGNIISSKEFNEHESSHGYVVPTEDLRQGIYHIHIFYKDKKTEVVKFIKN